MITLRFANNTTRQGANSRKKSPQKPTAKSIIYHALPRAIRRVRPTTKLSQIIIDSQSSPTISLSLWTIRHRGPSDLRGPPRRTSWGDLWDHPGDVLLVFGAVQSLPAAVHSAPAPSSLSPPWCPRDWTSIISPRPAHGRGSTRLRRFRESSRAT